MPVTSSTTEARLKLKTILETEFAPEGFEIRDGRLHSSLGREKTIIGTSPLRDSPWSRDSQVLVTEILVQFYGQWPDSIDPNLTIDPAPIENYAERLRRAIRGNDPRTDEVWFFTLQHISYPQDPIGQITRFEAQVAAMGNNPALIETTG